MNVGVHATTRPYLDLLFPDPGRQAISATARRSCALAPGSDRRALRRGQVRLATRPQRHADGALVARRFEDDPSQPAPDFFEHIDHQHARISRRRISTSSAANRAQRAALRRQPHDAHRRPAPDASDDPRRRSTSRRIRTSARSTIIERLRPPGSTATTPVDYNAGRSTRSPTRLTWSKRAHVMKSGFDCPELPLRRVLVIALRRRRSASATCRSSCTLNRSATAQAGPLHRQPARHRHAAATCGRATSRSSCRTTGAPRDASDACRPGCAMTSSPSRRSWMARSRACSSLDDLNTRPRRHHAGQRRCSRTRRRRASRRVSALAWNPWGDKTSTIKGGYGLFYQPLTTSFYRGTTFRIYPYFTGVDIRTARGLRARR